jgi:hypothetical protein
MLVGGWAQAAMPVRSRCLAPPLPKAVSFQGASWPVQWDVLNSIRLDVSASGGRRSYRRSMAEAWFCRRLRVLHVDVGNAGA